MCFFICNVLTHDSAVLEMSAFFCLLFQQWRGNLYLLLGKYDWVSNLIMESRTEMGVRLEKSRIINRKKISMKFTENNTMNENSVLEVSQCYKLRLWRWIWIKVLLDFNLSSCFTLGILLSKFLALISWSPIFTSSCLLELVIGEKSSVVWSLPFQNSVLVSVVKLLCPNQSPTQEWGTFHLSCRQRCQTTTSSEFASPPSFQSISHPLANKQHLTNPLEARPLIILAPESHGIDWSLCWLHSSLTSPFVCSCFF